MTSGVARHVLLQCAPLTLIPHGTNETRLLNLAVAGDERGTGDSSLSDNHSNRRGLEWS
jgi:hypothetical protein